LEWGERVTQLLPPEYLHIRLDYDGERRRIIHFMPVGEGHSKLAKELMQDADFSD